MPLKYWLWKTHGPTIPPDEEAMLLESTIDDPTLRDLLESRKLLESRSGCRREETRWFIKYLSASFEILPQCSLDLLQPLTVQDVADGHTPWLKFCSILRACDRIIASERNVSLRKIGQTISRDGLIQYDNRNQQAVHVFLFYLIGVLTMLFEPAPAPDAGHLEILPAYDSKRKRRRGTWRCSSIDIDKASKSIADIIRCFSGAKGPLPVNASQPQNRRTSGRGSTTITEANLNFYTLSKLAKIKTVWVSNICEHLEFDQARLELKIFQYPSFSVLVCLWDEEDSALTTICKDHYRNLYPDSPFNMDVVGLHLEILSSFRLVFGQRTDASRQWRHLNREKIKKESDRGADDPLLPALCGNLWSTTDIFRELDMPGVHAVYTVDHFPFFGQRLLDVQDYIDDQHPTSWKTLWRDRRDINKFWTFWAVFIFGATTIVIGLVQIGLAIAQVIGQFEDGK